MTKASPISKEPDRTPPRIWLQLTCQPFLKAPAPPLVSHVRVATQCKTEALPNDLEYLSVLEVNYLLAEARREAKASAFRECAEVIRKDTSLRDEPGAMYSYGANRLTYEMFIERAEQEEAAQARSEEGKDG